MGPDLLRWIRAPVKPRVQQWEPDSNDLPGSSLHPKLSVRWLIVESQAWALAVWFNLLLSLPSTAEWSWLDGREGFLASGLEEDHSPQSKVKNIMTALTDSEVLSMWTFILVPCSSHFLWPCPLPFSFCQRPCLLSKLNLHLLHPKQTIGWFQPSLCSEISDSDFQEGFPIEASVLHQLRNGGHGKIHRKENSLRKS